MDERAYYSESQTTKPAVLNCPVLPQRGDLRAEVDGAQEEGSPAGRGG